MQWKQQKAAITAKHSFIYVFSLKLFYPGLSNLDLDLESIPGTLGVRWEYTLRNKLAIQSPVWSKPMCT